MQAVQAMTGHGGWPMTVFLTPEGVPFYGGTYFPKDDRPGMPSFTRILQTVSNAYRSKPADVARAAASVREMYDAADGGNAQRGPARHRSCSTARIARSPTLRRDATAASRARRSFRRRCRSTFCCGTGRAAASRTRWRSCRTRSSRWRSGGIYDQVGGGFARYAVDAMWLVPHFEKMLYDNALLVRLGAHLWQATKDGDGSARGRGDDRLGDARDAVARGRILLVVRRRQRRARGQVLRLERRGDRSRPRRRRAGRARVLGRDDRRQLRGREHSVRRAATGARSPRGFRSRVEAARLDDRPRGGERSTTFAAQRVWPGRDDKMLASWNGLMVRGIAEAARAFGNDEYRDVAIESATFLFDSTGARRTRASLVQGRPRADRRAISRITRRSGSPRSPCTS